MHTDLRKLVFEYTDGFVVKRKSDSGWRDTVVLSHGGRQDRKHQETIKGGSQECWRCELPQKSQPTVLLQNTAESINPSGSTVGSVIQTLSGRNRDQEGPDLPAPSP